MPSEALASAQGAVWGQEEVILYTPAVHVATMVREAIDTLVGQTHHRQRLSYWGIEMNEAHNHKSIRITGAATSPSHDPHRSSVHCQRRGGEDRYRELDRVVIDMERARQHFG